MQLLDHLLFLLRGDLHLELLGLDAFDPVGDSASGLLNDGAVGLQQAELVVALLVCYSPLRALVPLAQLLQLLVLLLQEFVALGLVLLYY